MRPRCPETHRLRVLRLADLISLFGSTEKVESTRQLSEPLSRKDCLDVRTDQFPVSAGSQRAAAR